MARKDSPNQIAIYDAVKNGSQNIAVLATAGAGKTTTILKALHFIPKIKRTVFLSFSASIVRELKSKVPFHVKASTLHSIGFEMMRNYYKGKAFHVEEEGKYFKYAIHNIKQTKEKLDKKDFRTARISAEICDYARMTLTPHVKEEIVEMCAHYNIDIDEEAIELALKLLKTSLKLTGRGMLTIDFIDMIYFPAMTPEMIDRTYDIVFLDEAQDTNRCQLQIIELLLNKKGGRLISVGDDYQCIYGFSGADVHAFERIRERPNTITLPLSVSYRCARAVVDKARTINPQIEAWEEAQEGEERCGDWDEITETDMVLSRTTRPLISLYFKLIEKGIRAKVMGKDIERGLLELAEICMSESKEGVTYKINQQFVKLEKELTDLGIRKPQEHKSWRALSDKQILMTILLNKVEVPKELIPLIKSMFDEKQVGARLMTIHRAKGLEADRVFVIEKYADKPLMPSPYARQEWEYTQERNLQFVAFSRSKKSLITLHLSEENS